MALKAGVLSIVVAETRNWIVSSTLHFSLSIHQINCKSRPDGNLHEVLSSIGMCLVHVPSEDVLVRVK